MKFTSPFTILPNALKDKTPYRVTCFIDEAEVALKECGVQTEDKPEEPKLDFWDEECDEHPNNSHCKLFDE